MSNGARRAKVKMTPKRTPRSTNKIVRGSGNVFADLGVPSAEEELAKAELARKIGHIIALQKLTQVEAAARLGIDQPKVSALLRGKLRGFSSDRLFRFLNALGRDVEIVIRPTGRDQPARTTVVLAS